MTFSLEAKFSKVKIGAEESRVSIYIVLRRNYNLECYNQVNNHSRMKM